MGHLPGGMGLFFKLEYICFTMLLVSTIQQGESAINIHKSPLFWISLPFTSPQSTEESSLCYEAGSH